jgi:XTP/dITP diphosphohydrolase
VKDAEKRRVKLVLATRNRDKAREIVDLFAGVEVEVLTLEDFPPFPPTAEDETTLEGNAIKKAREAREHTGLSALADDTGLEVDALDGAPGVRAGRYAGEGATYEENCAKLLRVMADVAPERRGARFRTVLALALGAAEAARLERYLSWHPESGPRGEVDTLVSEGILHGTITTARRGAGGFGYDPLFVEAESKKTLAEMTLAEKNRTSHRYRALLEMREMLLRYELASPAASPPERRATPKA